MSQALYRKYRPLLWEDVLGQEHIVRTLKNAIQADNIVHAYLFSGPRGTGKTSTARLLAKAVNCLSTDKHNKPCNQCEHCLAVNENRFLDLIEIDAASNTSVDDVRDLRDKINFSPNQGKFKVYIIDEVHMLSTAAFNALLKTLEEPPAHAIFILATTESHKIPATVLSRCQRYEFRRIPVHEITTALNKIITAEKINIEPEALTLISRQSTGALRDAISLLDQLASTGETITLSYAQSVLGTATNQSVIDLVNAILEEHTGAGIDCIQNALDSGTDPRQFARQAVEYLRGLLLVKIGNASLLEVTEDVLASMSKQAQDFDESHLVQAIHVFNRAASELRSGWQPNLPLELALTESIQKNAAGKTVIVAAGSAHQEKEVKINPAVEHSSEAIVDEKTDKVKKTTDEIKPVPAETETEGEISQPSPPASAEVKTPVQKSQSSSSTSLQIFMDHWKDIRSEVKKLRPPTEALLNSCKLLAYKDHLLTLGFASEVVKSKMETNESLELTKRIIAQMTGEDVNLKCIVSSRYDGQISSDLDIPADSMVKAALDLGGKLTRKE